MIFFSQNYRATNKRWFSVVDICAAIMGCDYQKGRNYWKSYKCKLAKEKNETVSVTYQLKLEAADGKMRRTDAMDAEGILGLIESWPKGKGDAVKLWLEESISKGEDAAGLISEAAANVVCKAGDLLYVITRTVIFDRRASEKAVGRDACMPVLDMPVSACGGGVSSRNAA